MSSPPVEVFLNDLQLANPSKCALLLATRETIRSVAPQAAERVMYGGLMFSVPAQCCGVFAYAEHVSVEFGRGCDLDDAHGVLEGSGKYRRHIKLRTDADIAAKHLTNYIRQAAALAATA